MSLKKSAMMFREVILILSLSFIRHGLMFANTNVGSRMLYNCILAGWQPPGWWRKEMELQDGIGGRRRLFSTAKCHLHQNVKIKRKSPMAWWRSAEVSQPQWHLNGSQVASVHCSSRLSLDPLLSPSLCLSPCSCHVFVLWRSSLRTGLVDWEHTTP